MLSGGPWFGLVCWSPRVAPPAAELLQLGLLRSIGNLPVSERVQLPHLSQLRLHHGRLGVHREGDWPGLQPWWAVFPGLPCLGILTAIPAVGTWKLRILSRSQALFGIGLEQVEGSLAAHQCRQQGRGKGYGEFGDVKASFPEQVSVFIRSPSFLPEHPTRLLDVTSHCVGGHVLSCLSVCTPWPLSLMWNLLGNLE